MAQRLTLNFGFVGCVNELRDTGFNMQASAGSGHMRRFIGAALIGMIGLILSGCLPEGKSSAGRKGDAPSAADREAPGFSHVNRSAKTDPNLDEIANQIAAGGSGSGAGRTGAQEAAVFATAATSFSADDGSPPPIPTIEDIPEVPANVALAHFFSALAKLEKGGGKTVTILQLGDSHIAADRFSGGLREQFQSRFGDAGRGMLTPGLYLANGVKFDRGGEWLAALSTGAVPGPYGITGAKLIASSGEAWLRLTATDQPFTWSEITFDSSPEAGTVLISLDGEIKQASLRGPAQNWRNIRIERRARELLIRPKGDGVVTVHSITIGTDKPGVRFVNLGVPGATALTPLSWDRNYVLGDMTRLAPDLIILSYGTDESFSDNLDLNDYEAKASAAIARIRQSAPGASLMVVGPPDVSVMPKFASGSSRASDVCRALSAAERSNYAKRLRKRDPHLARWQPPLNLEAVRATLRRLAAAHNALFWDWSKLMGGPCGIHAWVHSQPPLAAADHIHLTEEGSKRSARLLFRELMNAYDAVNRTAAAK